MLFVLSSHLAPVAAGLLLGAGLVLVAVCARDQFPDFSARVAQGSPAPAPRGNRPPGHARVVSSTHSARNSPAPGTPHRTRSPP